MRLGTDMKHLCVFLLLLAGGAVCLQARGASPRQDAWTVDTVTISTRDAFVLNAYLLRPRSYRGAYPCVACFHQLWGNKDDFLPLFPYLARAGIMAIAADYPRQRPDLSKQRYEDFIDTLTYCAGHPHINADKLGVLTASFSVETGMFAIVGNPRVRAAALLGGIIVSECTRRWLTLNAGLAIFPITSIHDGVNAELAREYMARSVNPLSRCWLIDDRDNRYGVHAHGTFVFDRFPESLEKLQIFYADVFGTQRDPRQVRIIAKTTDSVTFPARDGMPLRGTYKKPVQGQPPYPALILYPPQFYSRRYYDQAAYSLSQAGCCVLAPNTKRTCRAQETLALCDKEILAAVDFLRADTDIDNARIGLLLPSFYFLFAKERVLRGDLPVGTIVLVDFGPNLYGIDMRDIAGPEYQMFYIYPHHIRTLHQWLPEKL